MGGRLPPTYMKSIEVLCGFISSGRGGGLPMKREDKR